MADLEEKPHANNGTHDPPLPSPCRRRLGRRADSKCCRGCFRFLFLVTVAAVVLTGFAILIFTIVINPHEMKFHISHASLALFDFSAVNETLSFKLKLKLNETIRNTNKKTGFYFTESRAYYDGGGVGFVGVEHVVLLAPEESTSEQYGGSYKGQRMVSFSSREIKRFNKLKSDGVFPFVMKFRILNAFKVDKIHIGAFRNKVVCR